MYDPAEVYLFEILEEYQEAKAPEEKDRIFGSFCAAVWSCRNKRRIFTKTISFQIRGDLKKTEVGSVFDTWSEIEYTGYKARTSETDFASLIRQKANNLYTRLFDERVVLNPEYLDCLKTPKRLYYEWQSGTEMTKESVTTAIDDAIDLSLKKKETCKRQKMSLTWTEYKREVEHCLRRAFDNSRLLEDFPGQDRIFIDIDCWNEDNFYIRYFCRCLDGYFRNYQKEYYGLKRGRNKSYARCAECGGLFEKTGRNHRYCPDCRRKKQLLWQRSSMKKLRSQQCEVL